MQNPNVKFSIQSPISASKKSFVYDGLRVILCGFFGMILLSVTIYYTAKGGIFIRDMISDSRQTSVLREFYLYLCAEPDFMLSVDRSEQLTDEIHRNHLATTNPEVIKRAMQKLAKQLKCVEELIGNPDFPMESLFPKRLGVFMVGPYLYIGTDNEGLPVCVGSPEELRVLLIDTRPLSSGQYLFVASDGSICKTGNQIIDQDGDVHNKGSKQL